VLEAHPSPHPGTGNRFRRKVRTIFAVRKDRIKAGGLDLAMEKVHRPFRGIGATEPEKESREGRVNVDRKVILV